LTALKNNIIDVIKQASGEISNWWLVAHMTNLLHHRGVLVMYQLEYGHKLSEYLILEYGSSLFVNPSLWQVAIDYFSYCPTKGRHYMSLFIERVQLTTINKCLKVVQICHKYELKEQAQSICRVLARRAFDEGQLSTALTWCLKSGDTSFAAFLAEKYFDKYEDIGEFCDLNVLDHLGGAMLLSNKLAFLGKYRECQKKYRRGEFKEAGLLMTDLILSNIVPEKYQLTMMVDLLPLLELKDMLVFDKMQTLSLMSHLHDLQYQQQPQFNQLKDDMEVTDDNITSSSNKITLLHSALTRNLSQAFISRRSTKIH
jgi:nuclear pore complex protein Nup85